MERLILEKLRQWQDSKYRKPLILKGIRQSGKTWVLREFGRRCYVHTAYISFDEHAEYKQFFETTRDVKRILQNLAMAGGFTIKPEATLIIFDEIQECPEALASLKYFCEEAPEYHVACAGSLLGIAMGTSFPVGKVDFLDIYPMNFTEFLMANGDENLVSYINTIDRIEPLPEAFFNPLYEKLKMFYVCGGMPEAVKMWTEERNVEEVQRALSGIIGGYERDFSKHPGNTEFPKISLIWQSLPSQLARENKKFLYRAVKEGARAREYESALQWLCDAGLAQKIYRITAPGLPLSAYDDLGAFKIYLPDVGLLRRLARLAPSAFAEENRLFTEFKGSLSENYVLQAIAGQFEGSPRYWTMENPHYEVDFLAQWENEIIPMEVKSETNVESKSLRRYMEKYDEAAPLGLRFSLKNLRLDGRILNIPLFLAGRVERFISLALKRSAW
ncbi:MAG: ATP-binding protein [Treponema sp.]|jgi:predicted AAA+ superfamily ATPase|nr:ATP-binding protein [Treponema sp.]